MKKCRVYHGTVAGKDDIFLESFIVTGALSGKTENPIQQENGFYVSLRPCPGAYAFSHTIEQQKAQSRFGEDTLRYGRGIIVELEVELNADAWDFDHEYHPDSLKLVDRFKNELPAMVFHVIESSLEDIPTQKPFFIKKTKNKNEMTLHFEDRWGEKKRVQIFFDHLAIDEGSAATFFLEQIHFAIKEKFPEHYRQVKQEIIDAMVEEGGGLLKYVGNQPLRARKIFLRPEDSPVIETQMYEDPDKWEADPLARWEVVYDRVASKKESVKPASLPQSPAAYPSR